MVAVAADHALELRESVLRRGHLPRLGDDQHAQAVAGVEQRRRRRVVRAAPGVRAQMLEARDPPFVQGIGNRRADAGVVVVVARALELERPAVEEEALRGIERDRADAERRLERVPHRAFVANLGSDAMEVRRLDRP